jgi:hypothetical protein
VGEIIEYKINNTAMVQIFIISPPVEAYKFPNTLFQPSQPLLCILNLSKTRISVFPEVEEFLVMLYGFGFP